MKPLFVHSPSLPVALFAVVLVATVPSGAWARSREVPRSQTPLHLSLIDQLAPQVSGPAFLGLDERRRGPIFDAALRQVVAEGKLPPVVLINRDLSIPATTADEPKVAPGVTLVRIYLTQWSQTPLGGIADTEILCRIFVEIRRDGRVEKKLGPFFAHPRFDPVTTATPQDRWAQYQRAARRAIEQMAAALGPVAVHR